MTLDITPLRGRQLLIGVTAALVIVGAISYVWRARSTSSVRSDLRPFEAIGEVAAQEVAKVLGGKGQIVLLVVDTTSDRNRERTQNAEVKSFLNIIKRQPGLTVSATERIAFSESDPRMGGSPLTSAVLFQLLDKFSSADAIVLLAGWPMLSADDIAKLRDRKLPKLVAFSTIGDAAKPLVAERIVQAIITPRAGAAASSRQKTNSVRELFDQSFTLITPETLAASGG